MELFDLYDVRRRPTGRTMRRGESAPEGLYHQVVHICIFNSAGEMLIQQRQPFKKGWPNMWDVSVGGAVLAGESSQQGAHRELLEELGLDADFEAMAPAVSVSFSGGFDDFYLLHRDVDPFSLRLQAEEVQAVKWASLDEILAMIRSGTFIPYEESFIHFLFFRRNQPGVIHNLT